MSLSTAYLCRLSVGAMFAQAEKRHYSVFAKYRNNGSTVTKHKQGRSFCQSLERNTTVPPAPFLAPLPCLTHASPGLAAPHPRSVRPGLRERLPLSSRCGRPEAGRGAASQRPVLRRASPERRSRPASAPGPGPRVLYVGADPLVVQIWCLGARSSQEALLAARALLPRCRANISTTATSGLQVQT